MEMQELNSEIRRLEGLQQTATIRMEMAQQRVFYDNQTTQNRSLISSSLNNYFRPFSNSEYRESIESRESDPSEPDTYTEYLDSSDRRIQSLSQNQISTSSSSNAGHRESSATGIIGKIIAKAPAGKRKELQDFLQSENLSDFFKEFLSECPRTRGWKNKEALMTQGLLNIVDQMSQNQALKTKCEILAETALGSCEDRVTLAFLQMQLAINLSGKELQNMSISEVYDYAKQESLMNFLTNKAEAKILQIEDFKRGIGEAEASRIIKDEIEIYLAYLQIGQELGLKMQASDMLYQACSHVSNEELQSAKQEFLAADQNQRIASHIYNDDYLKQHVFVKSIIEEVGNRAEFNADSEQSENDLDAVYLNRIKNLQQSFITTVISEISSEIEKAFVSPGHSVISPRASSTNQASNKSQQNS
jgi:hypothetical protein